MKTLKLYTLLIVALAAGFSACKKGNVEQQPVDPPMSGMFGKWVGVSSGSADKSFQDVYVFNADSSFTETRLKVDTVSGQPVSYQYQAKGKFHLNLNKLQLYGITAKYSDYYGPLNQLVDAPLAAVLIDYTLAFNTDDKSFHFVFPACPVNANCLATLTYKRQ